MDHQPSKALTLSGTADTRFQNDNLESSAVARPDRFTQELLRRCTLKNYYLTLCLEPTADPNQIKRSYFQLIKQFHPDRVTAHALGLSNDEQLDIVKAISAAYNILNSPKARMQYHQEQGIPWPAEVQAPASEAVHSRVQTRPTKPTTQGVPASQSRPTRPARPTTQAAPASQSRPTRPARPTTQAASASQSRPTPQGVPASQSRPTRQYAQTRPTRPAPQRVDSESDRTPPASSTSLRRSQIPKRSRSIDPLQALSAAVRLRSSRKSSLPPTQVASPKGYSQTPTANARTSKAAITQPARSSSILPAPEPAQHYVHLMEEAAAAQQWSSAASLGKMALQLNPENPAIARRQNDYQNLADRELAPQYQTQAEQAEAHRDYMRAASLYERAANGVQAASLYAKAAHCLERQAHEPRKLIDLCRHAVRLEPTSVDYKLVLIRAYMANGSDKSARVIFEQAQNLDRKSPQLKELAREFKDKA